MAPGGIRSGWRAIYRLYADKAACCDYYCMEQDFNHFQTFTDMRNKNDEGKLPYVSPTVEVDNFTVESGIATSFNNNQNAVDFTVVGSWRESGAEE